jgi:hypothetical protein
MNGKTASYLAAENGHETVVQLLLKHMANVDANDNDEWTARCIQCVQQLDRRGPPLPVGRSAQPEAADRLDRSRIAKKGNSEASGTNMAP